MAERALAGVGDANLGEWREVGSRGIVHLRRRLTRQERAASRGAQDVRDIRGSAEEHQRLARLLADAPDLREYVR